MRNFLVAVLLSLSFHSYAQEEDYRVIPSLTDWIDEINNWPDSIYRVKNIKVIIDIKKDSLLAEYYMNRQDSTEEMAATINKQLDITRLMIDNDFGKGNYGLKNIRFKEGVSISEYQSLVLHMSNLIFEKRLSVRNQSRYSYFNFRDTEFSDRVALFDFEASSGFSFTNCKMMGNFQVTRTPGKPDIRIEKCEIPRIFVGEAGELVIRDSKIEDVTLWDSSIESIAYILNNDVQYINLSGANLPANNTYIPFKQVSKKIYVITVSFSEGIGEKYFITDTMRFDIKEEYDMLVASYKNLLNGYQNRGDYDSYNACFVEMKNLETSRLAFLHQENPSFKGYFTWKINQFLKLFSAYGTEPARAVIVSLYVILGFALVYLFFPNHWDSHGRTRIMDRLRFFLKYSKQDEGVREVYLEEKKEELVPFEEFRAYFDEHGQKAPRFFYAIAIPLYKWSVSGTRMVSGLLGQVDVLGGTWENTPPSTRWLKSSLVIGAFLTALIYDLFVKVLNAIMLSINTFTTLGFGEIPIKGLPRYLAIIQGFIGWFMLTIFSVSLIAQLLN